MKKTISIVLIFALLHSLNGCYTTNDYMGSTKDLKKTSTYKKAKYKSGGEINFLYGGANYNDSTNSIYGFVDINTQIDQSKIGRIDTLSDYDTFSGFEDVYYVEIPLDNIEELDGDEYIFVIKIALKDGNSVSFADPGGVFLIKEGKELITGEAFIRDLIPLNIGIDTSEYIDYFFSWDFNQCSCKVVNISALILPNILTTLQLHWLKSQLKKWKLLNILSRSSQQEKLF